MSSGKVVLGAIAGLATGAILGILFAPEKGKDTRKKLTKRNRESMDDLKSKYDHLINALSDKYENAKHDASHLFASGTSLAQEAQDDATKLYSSGIDLAEEAKTRAAEQVTP
jgi:gas vesicle protein